MVSKDQFREEVLRIAGEMHAKPTQIRIRSMKSKKGSCTPKKIVTFDYSVLDLDELSRREVIVHELLHLRYRNHGRMFKLLMKEYLYRGDTP